MGQRLDREGKVGALARQSYDIWWNGGARTAPYYHNQIGILTETAHASATPRVYDPKDFPATFADGTSTTQPSVFYPSPCKGGEWHLSQSCAYIVSASWAMLRQASDDREGWLYGSYHGRPQLRLVRLVHGPGRQWMAAAGGEGTRPRTVTSSAQMR
ncbi:hypothetical protein AB0J82_12160 [Asanoa sp. NPDC049518]|uniref:hypothetical protein n=1 Tax=unclassified Asanoa TaxID=2685164 RepID=UPI00344635DD